MEAENEPSPNTEGAGPLILYLPASGTVNNQILLLINYPVCGVLLEQVAWIQTVGQRFEVRFR